MTLDLDVQFLTMVTMILCGIYLGIVQETFRRFQPHWSSNRFLLYVMEIGFWLSQVILIFYALFLVNAGELRFYVFLALFLGFAAYQALVAPIYKRVLEIIIRAIAAVYRFLERMVQTLLIAPVKFIVQLLVTIIISILQLIVSIFLFLVKIFFAPLKWIILMIYHILPEKTQTFLRKTAGIYSRIKNICKKGWNYLKGKRR